MTPLHIVEVSDGTTPVSLRDRVRLAVEILLAYGELILVVRQHDLPTMAARARQPQMGPSPPEVRTRALPAARRLSWMVERILALLPTDKRCLVKSLVLIRVLSNRSIPGVLVVGVLSNNGVKAHAWVEHDGHPVLPAGNFERLLEL